MARPMKKIEHDGELWCSVGHAATYLKTTAPKVRSLMGLGQLRYKQFKINGPLYIRVNDLVKAKYPGQNTD